MNILVTGGAGFLGTNITKHFIEKLYDVTVFDNLGRPGGGAERNYDFLKKTFGNNKNFHFIKADVTDFNAVKYACKDMDMIFHLAAQTAMTTSLNNPYEDFSINAQGSFNVVEATRQVSDNAVMVYTSTNKVYGNLADIKLKELETRWDFADEKFKEGIDETRLVSPEGPYGCSKYAGDCYFTDYAHTFGMNTIVLRCSAMYGGQQHATEDQGWIGWFLKKAIDEELATIYGDGKQVRDILFIHDVISAFELSAKNINKTKGQVYNIGGGRNNSLSILELIKLLKNKFGKDLKYKFGDWRRADQKIYISNTKKAKKDFEWEPRISKEEGIERLFEWINGTAKKGV